MRMITGLMLVIMMSVGAAAQQSGQMEQASRSAGRAGVTKKLIEFGWDEPDTAFMRDHAAEMDRSPFDGCVFHVNYAQPDGKTGNFTWECWGKRAFTPADLRKPLDELKAARFRRMTHNFLRFNTTPAKLDWFDDHAAVMNNARLAAWMAREGGCEGILFDIEEYEGQLFTYRKQRDAASKSWDQYAAQVRQRGREVIKAFEQGWNDLDSSATPASRTAPLTVFLTFGYCLPYQQSDKGSKPLADGSYGLLEPFMDGLVEGASEKVRLVDGNELAYGYREEKDFQEGRRVILQDVLPMVPDREKYGKLISVSFGLWMDYDWRNKGWNADDPAKNILPPQLFGQLVSMGLRHADEYVWIYTETPRWWTPQGGPVKLPPGYDAAVRAAHQAAASMPADR